MKSSVLFQVSEPARIMFRVLGVVAETADQRAGIGLLDRVGDHFVKLEEAAVSVLPVGPEPTAGGFVPELPILDAVFSVDIHVADDFGAEFRVSPEVLRRREGRNFRRRVARQVLRRAEKVDDHFAAGFSDRLDLLVKFRPVEFPG